MRRRIIIPILGGMLLCVCALMVISVFGNWQFINDITHLTWNGSGFTSVSAKATQNDTRKVETGTQLEINNDFGNLSIHPSSDASVHLTAEIETSALNSTEAQQLLSQVQVSLVQDGKKLRVDIQTPQLPNTIFSRTIYINLTLEVPPAMDGMYSTRFGMVEVSGLTGKVEIKNEYGDIHIADLQGEVKAQSNSGTINGKNLQGNSFISLQNEYGSVELQDASGSELNIRIENGAVTLKNLGFSGRVYIENNQGDINLTAVTAAQIDIQSNNGEFQLQEVAGDLQASSDNGSISVEDANIGKLRLTSQNGEIDFAGILNQSENHFIESANGAIRLQLPSDFAIQADISTDNGDIQSDFAIETLFSSEQSPENNAVKGKLNGGTNGLLEIHAQNGNIQLLHK